MSSLIKVKKGTKVHLTRGRGNNKALCGVVPPFKVSKSKVTCDKCDPSYKPPKKAKED